MQPAPAPGHAILRCPHPGCDGAVKEADLPGRLVECPDCHRLSARCAGIDSDGACPTLNRPLAHFCRHCRKVLATALPLRAVPKFDVGWAQLAWLKDILDAPPPPPPLPGGGGVGAEGANAVLRLGAPEPVLPLRDLFSTDPARAGTMDLCEAAGRLWIGAPDGRYLFAEPFGDRMAAGDRGPRPVLLRDQLWPERPSRLRAAVGGPWMVLYSENGVKAINLLTLEDPAPAGERHWTLWAPKDGERLVSDPVLLRPPPAADDPFAAQQRVVVWLTAAPDQSFLLWATSLSLAGPKPRRWRLSEDRARGFFLTGDKDKALLVPAPFGRYDRALLCLRHGLWLIDMLASGPDSPLSVKALLLGRRIVPRLNDAPGVVFMPGDKADDEATAHVYLACEEAGGGRRLHEISVAPDGTATPATHGNYDGVPFDLAEASGMHGVLCHSRQSLTLCNWMHQQTPLGGSQHLDGLTRAHVYGRVAVCSGTTTEGVPPQWFFVLMDLEKARIADAVLSPFPGSHPVVLGRFLFTLEHLAEPAGVVAGQPARPGYHLTRRTIFADGRGAGWQPA